MGYMFSTVVREDKRCYLHGCKDKNDIYMTYSPVNSLGKTKDTAKHKHICWLCLFPSS